MRALTDALTSRDALRNAPAALRRLLLGFGLHEHDPSLAQKLRLTVVGDWVFSRFEGSGHVDMRRTPLSPDSAAYRLLIIVTSGIVRPSEPPSRPIAETRQAALYRFDQMPPAIHLSGTLRNLVTMVPADLLENFEADRPISTEHGPGAVLAALIRGVEAQAAFGDTAIQALLPAIATLIRAAFTAPAAATLATGPNGRLARLLDFIEAHIDDPDLVPAATARLCGMSLRQLHRTFAATGESFAETVRRLRLQRAAALLADPQTHHRVTDVAHAVGFADPGYFATAFRAAYGTAPSRWRRNTD